MTGRPRGSADGRTRAALALFRSYLTLGGPVISVVMFLAGVPLGWVIGQLLVWLAVAKLWERMGGR